MPLIAGFQRWEHLLFLHWEVDGEVLQQRVPPPLKIDTFDGRAFVSILPFRIPESRPILLPRPMTPLFPGSSLIELNFRTYVIGPDDEPAIWFFSLDATSAVAVAGARAFYRLPYFRAEMCHEHRNVESIDFSSRRLNSEDGAGVTCTVSYRPAGSPSPATPGTLDHFLVERYLLFAGRTGNLLRARVHHPPYPLQTSHVSSLNQNLLESENLVGSRLSINHYAAGIDVRIELPERVAY